MEADGLAAVEVAGEHEVEMTVAGSLPDAGIVGAEDVDIRRGKRVRGGGPGDGEGAGAMHKERGGLLDPAGPGGGDGGADLLLTCGGIVVAWNGEDGGEGMEPLYQVTEVREFGQLVDEIAAEQDEIGVGAAGGIEDLRGEVRGPATAEVDVADVGDAAG